MDNLTDDIFIEEFKLDCFTTREEAIQYLLLKHLLNTNEPVGSWVLRVMLELKGITVGTATVGRYLKNLDAKKHTKLVGTQGRVITSKGVTYVRNKIEEIEREQLQKKLMEAAQPQNFKELIDLLRTRKILECESARLAAVRANSSDIESFELSMRKHEESVLNKIDPTPTALNFHRKVTEASKNRFLIAALDILIYEELKIESQFTDLILRERGEEYALQHRAIVEAIKKGNENEASYLMELHMEELIKAVEEQYGDK
ncbi:FCD domain-containing protein [bacterium LRH843]|nr:FCD domain-containing protein [bacterium LRH843]